MKMVEGVFKILHSIPQRHFFMDPTAAFSKYSQNGDFLTSQQCELALISVLGKVPHTFLAFSIDHKDRISQEEFLSFCDINKPDTFSHLRELFASLDLSGSGFITRHDLSLVLGEVAPHLGEEMLVGVFAELDSDHDSRLTFGDFRRAFEYATRKQC
ncbi:hypothetical protein P9112_010744 [Eukaryota sp. TZLM1-RC]